MIFVYIVPIILVLVHNVNSVDYIIKRVPRQKPLVYISNHPPLAETDIPVKVVYDELDDIPIRGKSVQAKEPLNYTEKNIQSYSDGSEGEKLVVGKSNDPIEINHDKSAAGVSVEKVKTSKIQISANTPMPKGRSLNFEAKQTEDSKKSRRIIRTRKNKVQSNGPTVPSDEINTASGNKNEKTNNRRTNQERRANASENGTKKNIQSSDDTQINKSTSTTYNRFPKRGQQPNRTFVPIVDSENYVYAYNGDYHYSYENGDGTKAYERGELKPVPGAASGSGVVGGFSYTDKDGNDFNLSYTADENGYRPIGAHLPTPPPIPPAIQRALAILATKTTPEPVTEKVKRNL